MSDNSRQITRFRWKTAKELEKLYEAGIWSNEPLYTFNTTMWGNSCPIEIYQCVKKENTSYSGQDCIKYNFLGKLTNRFFGDGIAIGTITVNADGLILTGSFIVGDMKYTVSDGSLSSSSNIPAAYHAIYLHSEDGTNKIFFSAVETELNTVLTSYNDMFRCFNFLGFLSCTGIYNSKTVYAIGFNSNNVVLYFTDGTTDTTSSLTITDHMKKIS